MSGIDFPPPQWLDLHTILPEYAMVVVSHVMISHEDERGDEQMDGMATMYTFIFTLREGPFDTPADEGGNYLDRTVAFTVPEGAALAMARMVVKYAEGRRSVMDAPLIDDGVTDER